MKKLRHNLPFITAKIQQELEKKLPGISSHLKMTPYSRKSAKEALALNLNPKNAAVLILLYQKDNSVFFTLTKRTEYNGPHGGQISLPGGKKEANETLKETALRETEEEIGIDKNSISILGAISQVYVPPSNFLITPFLAYINYVPVFTKQEREVASILEIPISQLLDENNVKIKEIPLTKYAKTNNIMKAPYFELNKHIVWGATAVILSELKDVLNR